MSFNTTAQPAEIETYDVDFKGGEEPRLQDGESISIGDSSVVIYDSHGDAVEAQNDFLIGAPTTSDDKLFQKVKWVNATKGEIYKLTFIAKVGSNADDHKYEQDVIFTIVD